MTLIVVGKRSLLTNYLKKNNKKCKIFSLNDLEDLKKLDKNKSYNIVINSFYPSSKLKENFSYSDFINYSVNNLITFLDILKNFKVKKIIYSSSSSVYNSLNSEIFIEKNFNRKIYATAKIIVENILTDFCSKRKISYINARIFNMYGENDKFSIISKIINFKDKKKKISIFNNGNSIRDFIHANDVAKIYLKLLKIKKKIFTSIDVGTGQGIRISDLVKFIGSKKLNINFYKEKINEASVVIADSRIFNEIIGSFKFYKLENFLRKYFTISKSQKLNCIKKDNFKNLLQDIVTEPIIIITSLKLKLKVKKIFDKNYNQPKLYVIDDSCNRRNIKYKNNFISFKQFKSLHVNKTISNIIVSNYNLKNKDKLYYWNKYKQFATQVSFYNFSKDLNFYEVQDDLNFNDLFDREEKKIISKNKNYFKKKKVLVTGGAGSIGSEICKQLLIINAKKVIAYDNSEFQLYQTKNKLGKKLEIVLGDINDLEYLSQVIKKYKIDHVFHAAAYKHVNILESNIPQAIKNNIFGTLSVVTIANKHNCKLSIISTDKSAKPSSILGYTKRISEIISKVYQNPKRSNNVIRFGNVFASHGSAIPYFVNQILKNERITITDTNVRRFFMSLSEAAQLVINSIKINSDMNSIIILEMGKQIKIINLVKKIIKILGKENEYKKKGMINFKKLNKGEKIQERLFIGKRNKIINNNIITVREPKYKKKDVDNLISNLLVNKNNAKKSVNIMKKFLIKEI